MACNICVREFLRKKKPTAKSSPFEIRSQFGSHTRFARNSKRGRTLRKLIFKASNVNNKHVVLSLFCRTAMISSVQFQR